MKFLFLLLVTTLSCRNQVHFSPAPKYFLIQLSNEDSLNLSFQSMKLINAELNLYSIEEDSMDSLQEKFPNSKIAPDLPIEFYGEEKIDFPINLDQEVFTDNLAYTSNHIKDTNLPDPYFKYQSYLAHYEFSYPSPNEQTFISSNVIAVVDTGVDYTHEELVIYENPKEIPFNHSDDDGNGFVDDWIGYDFADDDQLPFDTLNPIASSSGHGTSVAGLIGARGNNGIGITGIAPGVQILPLKIYGKKQTLGNALRAISYAAEMGATIINNSWGYPVPQDLNHPSVQIAKEFFELIEKKYSVVLVFAAGNNSINGDTLDKNKILIPAGFKNKNFLVVGASDEKGEKLQESNYGKRFVDIFGVADLTISLFPLQRYINFYEKKFCALGSCVTKRQALQGTSQAAALMSGAILRFKYLNQDLQEPSSIISEFISFHSMNH